MKILVMSSFAFSLINFRGELLRSMVRAGHQVVACAPDDDPAVAGSLANMGIRYVRLPMARASTNPFSDVRTLAACIGLMRRERPDAVLAYTQKPIIYGGIAARLTGRWLTGGRPFYALMTGLGYAFGGDADDRPWLRRIVRLLYREGVRRARMIFVFNRDDRPDMLAHGIITERSPVMQVPGSGIDLAHFARQPLPDAAPRFLMIARLMRDKGLYEFVEAARALRQHWPNARFHLLGRIDADNPTSVSEAEVQRWQAEGIIEYTPETRDVRPFLAASSVFVLPSYYREGLPRTILEAMATGRAIITADMPGCREPVCEGANGFLVPPRDAVALAGAMAMFLRDPALAARMGAASRLRAEQVYDVHRVNAQLMQAMRLDGAKLPVPEPGGLGALRETW